MELDDLLQRYFGTRDPAAVAPEALAAGVERMRVDLGLESNAERRFALWTLLLGFDAAPEPDIVFKDTDSRAAASRMMAMMAASQSGQDTDPDLSGAGEP